VASHDDTATGTGLTARELPADDVTTRASGGVLVADDSLADDSLAEELLVEEISIDGMCGVY